MSTVNAILGYIIEHWTAISSVLLFIFTIAYGYKNPKTSATDYAKCVGSKIIFGLEKRAEEYLITTGAEKLKLAVESGYDLFPKNVRFFISKPDFLIIVQGLHDEAIAFLETEVKKQTPIVTPVVAPITPTQPAQVTTP